MFWGSLVDRGVSRLEIHLNYGQILTLRVCQPHYCTTEKTLAIVPQLWRKGRWSGIYYNVLWSLTARRQQGGTEAIEGEGG